MFRRLICLVIFLPSTNLSAQEIVAVEEVKPHTRLLVKQPNGAVYISKLEQLFSVGSSENQPSLQFLSNPRLLEAANLSQSQKNQLEELKKEYQSKSKKLTEEFKTRSVKLESRKEKLEMAKKLMEEMNSLQKGVANKIEMELIPFQATIIKKYKFKQMSYLGFHRLVLQKPFVEDLKLSKKQNDALEKIAKETEKEIADLIKKAREKAKSRVMKELDAEQRKYINSLSEKD